MAGLVQGTTSSEPNWIKFLVNDDQGLCQAVARVLGRVSEDVGGWVLENVMFVRHAYALRIMDVSEDKGLAFAAWFKKADPKQAVCCQRFISLSDSLADNRHDPRVVDAVIAHEVAHQRLGHRSGHKTGSGTYSTRNQREDEADELVRIWGFNGLDDARCMTREDWGPAILAPPWPADPLPEEVRTWHWQ